MDEKIVDFKTYCPTCEYAELKEHLDPCNDCLTYPTNANTHEPVLYKEKTL